MRPFSFSPRRVAAQLAVAVIVTVVAIAVPRSSSTAAAPAAPHALRYFVVLRDPPLAEYRGGIAGLTPTALDAQPDVAGTPHGAHLDTTSPAAQAYIAYLKGRQAAAIAQVRSIAPEFTDDDWTYQIVLDGFVASLSPAHAAAVARMPNVLLVHPSEKLVPELDGTMRFLGTREAWEMAGGVEEAGVGARVAILEGGSAVDHPFFNDDGMPDPPTGYPSAKVYGRDGSEADIPSPERMTNGKIIGARVITNQINQGGLANYTTHADTFHGVHTSGIATGRYGTYNVDGEQVVLSGVAPNAFLFHYYNTDDTPGYVKAFEIMVEDQIDAVNMSLGQVMWLLDDGQHHPMALAQAAAADAGVLTVASSGNAGSNGPTSLSGGWKYTDKILTVGNTTSIGLSATELQLAGPGVPDELKSLTSGPPRGDIPIDTPITGLIALAENGGCTPGPQYQDKIVVAERFDANGGVIGGCGYTNRAQYMADSGAKAILFVYYNAYNPGGSTTATALPTEALGALEGTALVNWLKGGGTATATVNGTVARRYTGIPDVLAGSSSRGPGLDWSIQPDLSAPGDSIISSVYDDTDNNANTPVAPTFEALSGTSMAAPHVTGAAGLLRSMHPDWTVPQLRSALVNTTVTSVKEGAPLQEQPASPVEGGAGRLNLFDAPDPRAFISPTMASFGAVDQGTTEELTFEMESALPEPATWQLSVTPGEGDSVVSVSPETIELGPGEKKNFTVTLDATSAADDTSWGDIGIDQVGPSGPVTFTVYLPSVRNRDEGAPPVLAVPDEAHQVNALKHLHVPYYAHIEIPEDRKDVLIIDWTVGNTQDYTHFYTDALDALGLSYDVWGIGEAGEHPAGVAHGTHPPLAEMKRHDMVILNTNMSAVSLQTVTADYQYNNYALGGGNLLIAGQGTPSWWRYLDYTTLYPDSAAYRSALPDTWPRRWLGPSQNVGCEMCMARYFAGFTPVYTSTLSGKLLIPFPMKPSEPQMDVQLTRDPSAMGGLFDYALDISTGNKAKDGAAGNQYRFASGHVMEDFIPSGSEQVTAQQGDVSYAEGVMDRYASLATALWNYKVNGETMVVGTYIAGKTNPEAEVPWNVMFWGFGLEGVGSAGAGTASRQVLLGDTFNFLARNMVVTSTARWSDGALALDVDLGAHATPVRIESAEVELGNGQVERVPVGSVGTTFALPALAAPQGVGSTATVTLFPERGTAAPIRVRVALPNAGGPTAR